MATHNVFLRRSSPLIALILAFTAVATTAHAQYTWLSPKSGYWSNPSNWKGVAPPFGGGPGLNLMFSNTGSVPYSALNDLGNPFTLTTLKLDNRSYVPITLANAASNTLRFQGGNAGIFTTGFGLTSIAEGGLGISLGTTVEIGGTGTGPLVIDAPIWESGGSFRILINGNPGFSVALNGRNTFSGGVILNSGTLSAQRLNNSGMGSGLGTGPLFVNGGRVNLAGPFDNAIILNADLDGQVSLSPLSSISANNSTAGWRNASGDIACAATYRGPTTGTPVPLTYTGYPQSRLYLTGNASMRNSSSFTFSPNDAVYDYGDGLGPSRFNPAAPFLLDGGQLWLMSGQSNVHQVIGDLRVGQSAQLSFGRTYGFRSLGPAVLRARSLEPFEHGTLLYYPAEDVSGLGSRVLLDKVPKLIGGGGVVGTPTQSIVPFVFGGQDAAQTLVTYGPDGLRPLDPYTEFATSFGGNPMNNVVLSRNVTLSSEATVNAVLFSDNGTLDGTGPLHITSGVFMGAGDTTTDVVAPNIDFGSAEGIFYGPGCCLQVNGNLRGSGGLNVVNGREHYLRLSGDNSGLTGDLTVQGTLTCLSPQSLPGTGAILLRHGWLGIMCPLNSFTRLQRDLHLHEGISYIDETGGLLQLDGLVSGDGDLYLVGRSEGIRLSAANTYSGRTFLTGKVFVGEDGVFGNSRIIYVYSGDDSSTIPPAITLEGNWTTDRDFDVFSTCVIDTNGYSAKLGGSFSMSSVANPRLYKTGSGTLTINAIPASPYLTLGHIRVYGGTCVVNGSTDQIDVQAGGPSSSGTLAGTGTVTGVSLTPTGILSPGVGGPGTFTTGALTWDGGGSVNFDLGQTSDLVDVTGPFSKGAPGSYVFHFNASANIQPGTYTLVKFADSGGFSASDFSYTGLAVGRTGHFNLTGSQLQFVVN